MKMNLIVAERWMPATMWNVFRPSRLIRPILQFLFLTSLKCHVTESQIWQSGIRLSEGDTVWDGRLEIEYRPSQWGTLCNNFWTWEAAAVACHQLSMGPPLAHLFPLSPDFSLPIVYDSAMCKGDESHLSDCNLSLVNIGACHHSQDVTLRCTPDVNYQDYDVVTVENSTTTMEIGNLVLIYFENSWHTLCDETWNKLVTTALCNQLGQGQGEHSFSAEVPQIFHLYKCLPQYPSCSGSEDRLNECKWIDSAGQPAENKLYLHVKCQSSLISPNQGTNSTDDPSNGQRSVSGGLIAFFLITLCLGAAFAMCKIVQRFNRRISTESDEAESQPQIQVLSVRSLEQVDDFVLERPPDVQVLPDDIPPSYQQFVTNPELFGMLSEQNDLTGASESSRAVANDPIESPPPDYATVTFDIPDVDSARNPGQQDGSSGRGVDPPEDNSGGNSEVQEDISARSLDLSEDNSGRHLEQRDDISEGSLSLLDSGSERSYDTRL